MKGMQGLIIAGMLGLLGVALNWIYLHSKTKDIKTVVFLGIEPGSVIEAGEVIKETQLAPVAVPEANTGNLQDFVYLYKDRDSIVGFTATRPYAGGDLIYREHNRRPPTELKLETDEKLIWVSANSNSFVPSLVDPGDTIEFVVPIYAPSSTSETEGETISATARPMRTETIGPFRVGSLGNRLASENVSRGNRVSTSQERLVGIVVDTTNPQEMQNAERLQARVLAGEYRNIGVNLLEKTRR